MKYGIMLEEMKVTSMPFLFEKQEKEDKAVDSLLGVQYCSAKCHEYKHPSMKHSS